MTQEALKHLKAITEAFGPDAGIELDQKAWAKLHTAIKEALAQEQEPVAWLITDEKINSLQVNSIQRLVDRARHAHMTDIKLRINGQDEWHQADWLKHLTRTTPPQRSESSGKPSAWVGLTDEDRQAAFESMPDMLDGFLKTWGWLHFSKAIEAKLKEKNT